MNVAQEVDMIMEKPRLPLSVQWYEGMLLTPQHFQQADRYTSALGHFWAAASSANPWGVIDVDFDVSTLMQGVFKMQKAKLVFPDGFAFDYNPSVSGGLSFDLNSIRETFRRQAVILALRLPQALDSSLLSTDQRFGKPSTTHENDETMAHNSVAIQRKVPNVSLGIYDPGSAKYVQVPIAEIVFDGEVFRISDYHPPAFRILRRYPYYKKMHRILTDAREKMIFLAEQLKMTSRGSDTVPNTVSALIFRVLAQLIPQLEWALSQDRHPSEIQALWAQLSGALSFANDWSVPPKGDEFSINDIKRSIDPHMEVLCRVLEKIKKSYDLIELELRDGGFQIDLGQYQPGPTVLIAVSDNYKVGHLQIAQVLDQSLIGGADIVPDLRRKRTLGAARKILPRSENERLGLGGDIQLVQIEFDGSLLTPTSILEIRPQSIDDAAASFTFQLVSPVT